MDWTMVPSDVWLLISSKLDAATDQIRLRAVSKYFISCLPVYQPIWLMLSEDRPELFDGEAMRHLLLDDQEPLPPPRRGFIPVGEGEQCINIHELDLPDAHQKRCVSSTGTWLVTVDIQGNLSLLNIFTRLRIDLPSQWTFEDNYVFKRYSKVALMNGFLRKVVFSSSDLTNSKAWVAMAIYHPQARLAICKPGDASWTDLGLSMFYCEDVIHFRGRFHIVDAYGEVAAYNMDTDTMDYFSGEHHLERDLPIKGPVYRHYLVEWMGELLLVKRTWSPRVRGRPPAVKTLEFHVFKRDFANKEWVQLKDLGEYCLFLGLNTSVAVSVPNYTSGSLRKNCIYFTGNHYIDLYVYSPVGAPQIADDMGVYSLEDESIQPLYHGICTPSCSLPIWIIPQLHHTCL